MVPECFPRVDVGKMDLDRRDGYRRDGVTQGNAGVGQAAGVDDDAVDPFRSSLMNAINQLSFVVGLKAGDCHNSLGSQGDQAAIDVVKRLPSVDFGFADAEEVEVRTVQNEDMHDIPLGKCFAKAGRLTHEKVTPLAEVAITLHGQSDEIFAAQRADDDHEAFRLD